MEKLNPEWESELPKLLKPNQRLFPPAPPLTASAPLRGSLLLLSSDFSPVKQGCVKQGWVKQRWSWPSSHQAGSCRTSSGLPPITKAANKRALPPQLPRNATSKSFPVETNWTLKRPLEGQDLAEGGKSACDVPSPHHSWMSGHF